LLARLGPWLHLTPERLEAGQSWYHRHGTYALLLGYFLPGVRHLVAYVAGWSHLPLPAFGLWASIGGLLWFSTFLTLGYVLGNEWTRWSGTVHRLGALGAIFVLAAAVLVLLRVQRRAQPKARSGTACERD